MAKVHLRLAKEETGDRRLKGQPTTLGRKTQPILPPRVWSEQQVKICNWFRVPDSQHLIVRSLAGSGKTSTAIEALTHIRPPTGRILLCAFGKRNKIDLTSRIAGRPLVEARTFHALGRQSFPAEWTDVEPKDQVEWDRIEEVLFERPSDEKILLSEEEMCATKRLVSWAKQTAPFAKRKMLAGLSFEIEEADDFSSEQREKIGRVARLALRKAADEPDDEQRISFDDMLFLPVVNGWLKRRYRWVIVDEFQDLSPTQLLMAQEVVREDGHLVFIGDPRQGIFSWRGADANAMERLKADLKAKELTLTVSFRCPVRVVEDARRLVHDFQAAPGAPLGMVATATRDACLIDARPGDVVLSRLKAPLVGMCLGILRRGTPAVVAGRDIGKDLLGVVTKVKGRTIEDFLRRLHDWEELRAGRLRAAQGKFMARKLAELADQCESLRALSEGVLDMLSLKLRVEKLFAEVNDRSKIVTCSTIHKAKGLEWRKVWLLSETLYRQRWRKGPLREAVPGAGALEVDLLDVDPEEQNLEYVAITRAQEELVRVTGVMLG